jgi:galactokinase
MFESAKRKFDKLENPMMAAETLGEVFAQRFGGEPALYRSPGRVNMIGEHTDYNEGFVLPGAIDRAILLAVAPREDRLVRLYAADLDEAHETDLDRLERSAAWTGHLLGVADQMVKGGHASGGFDCAFGGDIPIGAGLASSAAISAGLAFALNDRFGAGLDRLALARLAQRAEQEFAGVRCGIMDQFASLHGRDGHLLLLDCRTQEYEAIPFALPEHRIVLCDTGVKRELASSEYNDRRAQCEEGVEVLRKYQPEVRALRDATPEMLARHQDELDEVVYRRCDFVIRENARVIHAVGALARRDLPAFGRQMFLSHAGLREEYEVSCPELDALVAAATTTRGVLGARMMGAGFGGCTVNLVAAARVEAFSEAMRRVQPDVRIDVVSTRDGTARL